MNTPTQKINKSNRLLIQARLIPQRLNKALILNISLALIAISLLGGILFYKYKVDANIFSDSTSYYPAQYTKEEITTQNITISNIKDDWRSTNITNPALKESKVSPTDLFNGTSSISQPHNNLSLDFSAVGVLGESTKQGYNDQAQWIIQPTLVAPVDQSTAQPDYKKILDDYRQKNNILATTNDAEVLDQFCKNKTKTNKFACISKANELELIKASLSIDPSNYITAYQNPNNYQSIQKGTVGFVGREEQVKNTTKNSVLDPNLQTVNFTSTTGASLYKTAKDAESILATYPNVKSGNLAQSSSDVNISYTTNSAANPAFIPTSGDLSTQPKDGKTQVNQSNTGKLYTSPVVFDEGNKLPFDYSYSVSKESKLQNLDPSKILIDKYPDNVCNAHTCYDLVNSNIDPKELQTNCNNNKGTPCYTELLKIGKFCSSPSQAEITRLSIGQACSLDKVDIKAEIRSPLQAPIGGSIVSPRISQIFNNFSLDIRFNPLSPVLYTPVDATFDLKGNNTNISINAPSSAKGYLVGGKIMTYQSQLINSLAQNMSPVALGNRPAKSIFKGAYSTSDDRTIGIGFIPDNTPNSFTKDFGAIYELDNSDSSYSSIAKDQSNTDRKFNDFISQIQGKLWNFGTQTFSNDSKIIFSEGKTDKDLEGVTILQDLLHGTIFNFGQTGSMIMFAYNPNPKSAKQSTLSYSIAKGIDQSQSKVETPSSVTGRVCISPGNCYDDMFLAYPSIITSSQEDKLKITRTFKNLETVILPKLKDGTQSTDNTQIFSSDTLGSTDQYKEISSPSYLLTNSTKGKLFTFDNPSDLSASQNILSLSTNDKGESNIAMGQLDQTIIKWNDKWGNQTSLAEISTKNGKNDSVITKVQKLTTRAFPFALGSMQETDFYSDNFHGTYNIITRYGKDNINHLVIYSWPQNEAPTKENVRQNFVPSFPETRLVGAKIKNDGTAYIVTYKDLGRDKPTSTYIYENQGDKYFKVSIKNFDADSTSMNGQPYTWDKTNYKQVGYPKPATFELNNSRQFDNTTGIDLTFTTPPDGSKFVYHMSMPYSRTSMFWDKDQPTYIYTSNKDDGFQPITLDTYYKSLYVYPSIQNLISTWENAGFTKVIPQNQIDGITKLDNMSLLNPYKLSVQNEFNALGDNGDIKTFNGRKDNQVSLPITGGNNLYSTKFCEEKWCVSDSTPYVGDQFTTDCDTGPLRTRLYDLWNSYVSQHGTVYQGDFDTICNSAKAKKVSMAMMLAVYKQESGMNRSAPSSFGCKIAEIEYDYRGQVDCAANTIAIQVNLYNSQPESQKVFQFETANSQACIPGSAFSANMENYTPLDRRNNVVGKGDGEFNRKNSCNRGLVDWASSTENCGEKNSQEPLSGKNWPGCFNNKDGLNFSPAKVPIGCENVKTDVMLESRPNLRTALMSGKVFPLDQLSKGDVASTLDPRLKLTTACFGSSSTNSPGPKTATTKDLLGKEVTLLDTPVNQYVNQGFDKVGPKALTACGATTTTMISAYFNKITTNETKTLTQIVGTLESNDFLKQKFPNLASLFDKKQNEPDVPPPTLPKGCGGIQHYVSSKNCEFYSNSSIGQFLSVIGLKEGPDLKATYDSVIMFDQIKKSIDAGNPLLIVVNGEGNYHNNDFSHVMMIVGYSTDNSKNNNQRSLVINDPWSNRSLDPTGKTSQGNKEGVGGYHALYPYDADLLKVIVSVNSITQ